jgi:nucleotide-binding universal stress UspA family protein
LTAQRPHETTTAHQATAPLPFPRIVCGVNGTRSSAVAVERAIELADGEGAVEFLAFTDVRGTGMTLMAGTGVARAERALDAARRAAANAGVTATTAVRHHG